MSCLLVSLGSTFVGLFVELFLFGLFVGFSCEHAFSSAHGFLAIPGHDISHPKPQVPSSGPCIPMFDRLLGATPREIEAERFGFM